MFHRFVRYIVATAILTSVTFQISALGCPDVNPVVYGPDAVREGQTVEYFTPYNATHTYVWSIPGGGGFLGSVRYDANYMYQTIIWNTIAGNLQDFTVRLEETYLGCTDFKIHNIKVFPLLQAYFYYEPDPDGGCFFNKVNFTGDVSKHSDPNITYSWNFGDGSPISNSPNPLHVFPIVAPFTPPYTFTVVLEIQNTDGQTDMITDYVYVDPDKYKPTAVITNPVAPACEYDQYVFSAASSLIIPAGSPASNVTVLQYDWFVNGTLIETNYPPNSSFTYTFPSFGSYLVEMKLTNSKNCDNTTSFPVQVLNTRPTASFDVAQTCVNEFAPFTDHSIPGAAPLLTITNWWWDWDDGSPIEAFTTYQPIVYHRFTDLNLHNVTLTIKNSNGCVNTSAPYPVTAQASPQANFTFPVTTCDGQEVQFDGSLSSPLTGPGIVSYEWDFNDPLSPSPTGTGLTTSHIFSAAGTYLVSLTVTNSAGCANTKTLTVNDALVVSALPTLAFSYAQGATTYEQIFTSVSNAGNNVFWDFGDGNTGFGSPITHLFPGPNIYPVTCTAINTTTQCSTVVVQQVPLLNAPPTPCFTALPSSQCQNAPIQFVPCLTAGTIFSEDWDFDDGVTVHITDPALIPYSPVHIYNSPGQYHVTRVLNIGLPTEVSSSLWVTIFDAPTADFTWFSIPGHQGEACSGEVVNFSSNGSHSNATPPGTIYKWAWDFGDPQSFANNFSTLENPTHTFTTVANGGSSVYHVKLTVWDNLQDCPSLEKVIDVTINPPIPIDYTIPTAACVDQLVTFQATAVMDPLTIASWSWDFGDGTPVSIDPVTTTHAYSSFMTGMRTTTLTVVDIHGCSNTLSKDINVIPSPTAGFTYSSPSCEGDVVSFTDESTPGGPAGDHIVKWEWFWGDNPPLFDPEVILFGVGNPNVQHTFPVILGTYSWPVRLRVTNTYGCVSEKTINVNLLPAPVAGFVTVLGTYQCAGQPVQFQSSGISNPNGGGPIIEWFWNFGDNPPNNTAFTENPSHTYALDGIYTVTLKVKTANNCTSTLFSKDVTVNKLPLADFTYTTVCEGDATVFTDISTANASGSLNYLWDFGGGVTSPSPSPSYVFPTAGNHTVTLSVTNSNGCFHSVTKQVMVNPKALALFHFTTPSCQNSTITFYSDSYIPNTPGSTATITSWAWDFGDMTTANGPLVVHTYSDNLTAHVVTLTITTSDLCESAITHTITHSAAPSANFSHTGYQCESQTINFFDNSLTVGGIAIASRLWNFADPGSIPNNTSTLPNPTHDFSTFGSFNVSLIVTDINGCVSAPKIIPVIIEAKPVAAFSAPPVCLGSSTIFTDQSTPLLGITSWFWQYDDGTTDVGPNPTHPFATAGQHSVTLTVTTPAGCFKSITQQVEVYAKPIVTFSNTAPVCAGNVVTFTDNSSTEHGYIQTRTWNFGDGPSDPPTPNPTTTHTYATGGTYTVTLTINTSDGCVESTQIPIQIKFSPIADFYNSATLCEDMTVQFNQDAQPNGGSPVTSYLWNFDDLGSPTNTSTAPNPIHTFNGPPAVHNVTLTVSNVDNCTSTASHPITIGAAPTALFTPTPACQNQSTTFDASASNTLGINDITAYAWDFGDTQTGTGQITSHTYANFGYYDVVLTITNASGCISANTQRIFVQPTPVAQFTFSQVNCIGADVSYYNSSFIPGGIAGTIEQWKWEYGDGQQDIFTPATVPTVVTHTFNDNLPVHTVKLTVTTSATCESFVTHDVNSVPSPIAHITVSPTTCVNQSVQFNSGTSDPNGGSPLQSYAWVFGDGGTSGVANPIHTYVTSGPRTVTLTVTNQSGCVSAPPDSKQITINAKPTANFTHDDQCQGGEMTFTDTSVPNAGTIVTRVWDFGDLTTLTNPSPPIKHTYATSGTFQVTLTVTTDNQCFKDTTMAVDVYGKPIAAFTTSATNCAGDSVAFSAASSIAAHGYITEYKWDFNDGTPIQTKTTPNIKHKFVNGGTYNVKLTIKTSDDCTDEKINPVTVKEKPLADFEVPAVLCALMQTQFTDISQGGGGSSVTGWAWNFGDPGSGANNVSPLPNPVHIFSAGNATDTVRLIVTNANGCRDTTFKVIAINDAPFAVFTADTSCMTSPTQFNSELSTPTGNITTWTWNFGDPASGPDNTSTLQNPVHTYNTQGTYPVTLSITSNVSCVKDTTMQVTVNPKPTAMFVYTPACVGDSTQFTDQSLAPGSQIESWYWDFGCTPAGSCTSIEQNPKFAFPAAGNYNVKLKVITLLGCTDSITIPVIARPIPKSDFTSISYFCPAGKVDFQDISTAVGSSIAERLWTFVPGSTSNIPNPSFVFPVANMSYDVTLNVTDTYGCKDDTLISVFVKPGFTFSFTNSNVCEGLPTQFDTINVTPGDHLYNVAWNFGDPASVPNNTSILMNPTHVFSKPGTFVVKMKAYNSDNCVDSIYQDVIVYETPKPLFSYIAPACNDTIHFTDSTQVTGSGTITNWDWDFGDLASLGNNTSTLQNPSHEFASAGMYQVTLKMTSSFGCVDSIVRSVQRFPCIIAGFSFNDTLCARYRVAFSDNSIPPSPNPLIKQWRWSWGDGTPDTTYTTFHSPIMHTYADSGSYNVTLEVQTTVNGTPVIDNLVSKVVVRPTPITFFSNVPVCLEQPSLFRDTSKTFGAGVSKWSWTFGIKPTDTSTMKNPPHVYDTAGIYNVQLVVTNKYGCKDSLTKPTRVYGLPVAHYDNTVACTGDPTFFTDNSVSSDTTLWKWRWFFGDPTTNRDSSHLQSPSYRYPNTGDFTVKMIVQDHFGCIDEIDSTVTVNITPVSSFTVVNDYNGKPGQVKINNLSTGAESYTWSFGNGKYSTEENPVALFTEDGTYTIQLISLNQFNCTDTTFYEYKLLFRGLYVPNAFAPSSTDLGVRLFKPIGMNLKQYHVTVFDMWGHLMWESSKLENGLPSEGWDGTFEGVLMPQGNYMWRINALFEDNSQWEGSDIGVGTSAKTMGTVTLIR